MKRQLGSNNTQLQHLISDINANAQIGEIIRASYRYGIASHSDRLRDAKKIRFYIDAEIKRLEMLAVFDDVVSQCQAIIAQDDGWIEWKGGECPVDPGVMVECRISHDGTTQYRAGGMRWTHKGFNDITSYRIVKES